MSHGSPGTDAIYGLMAEFDNPTDLVSAANRARLEGYRDMDAYSPMPIEELNEALGIRKTKLPLIVLIGGICGGLGGYMLEYWSSVIAYPMNIFDNDMPCDGVLAVVMTTEDRAKNTPHPGGHISSMAAITGRAISRPPAKIMLLQAMRRPQVSWLNREVQTPTSPSSSESEDDEQSKDRFS